MVNIKAEEIRNILIIRKHNQIGDILVSVPMYYALKKYFPQAKITLLASKTNYPIPFNELNQYIDKVIIYEKSTFKQQIQTIKLLRKRNFDLAIVPATIRLSSTSNLISFLAGIRYRVGVSKVDGKKNKLSFLLNIKNEFNWEKNKTHQVLRNLEVVEQINCKISLSEALCSFFKISNSDKVEAKKFLYSHFQNTSTLIGFHPGAGKIDHMWDWKNFVEVAKLLYKKWNSSFIITCGATDKFVIEKIREALNYEKIPFIILENLPIKKLSAVINECDLFITNDTGVMHIAGLTETLQISLFKKNKAFEWAPLGKNKFFIESPDEKINSISFEQLFQLADKLLYLKRSGKN